MHQDSSARVAGGGVEAECLASSPTRLTSMVELDKVYEELKEHDREWLQNILIERRRSKSSKSNGTNGHAHPHNADSPKSNGRHKLAQRPALTSGLSLHSYDTVPLRQSEGWHSDYPPVWHFDLTASELPNDVQVSDHVKLIRQLDWAATGLGPMSSWTPVLRRMFNILMADPRPAALHWGKDHISIWNEAYVPVANAKHPQGLGQPFAKVWPEVMDSFGKSFGRGIETGKATTGENSQFFLNRSGYVEEMYASWANIPVPAEHGQTGFYNPVFETTNQVLTERRMSTLVWLGQCLSLAKDTPELWKQALRGLLPNEHDIPFAALYALAEQEGLPLYKSTGEQMNATPSDTSSAFSTKQWTLEGMVGLPSNCSGLPSRLDSEHAASVLTPAFGKAMNSGEITLLSVADGTFPTGLTGVARSRGFGDNCEYAVLCPVRPTTNRENARGFMIIGINPRRKYDNEYNQFFQVLTRQLATSMASTMLVEDELRRSRIAAELAAQDRIRMSEQLAVTKQEAIDSESRFRRMADLAPMSMFRFDEMGNVLYANDAWFELTQHPRDAFYPLSWYNVIHEDDHSLMDQEWAKLGAGEPVSFELRLKRPFTTGEMVNGERVEGLTWIIACAYCEKRDDGSVKAISGCLTDISRQKWAEDFQLRRRREAMELKRQQENFMDMTSHEARNPLSAITLCTESIVSALKEMLEQKSDQICMGRDVLEMNLENAEIIMTCAQHQKRIIDDVLTLSKLDSGMLLITPVEVQPAEAICQALKMFDSELQKADVGIEYVVDSTYHALEVDWVKLDPSRVLQVLINFLTNAIKFTQTQAKRQIKVVLRACGDQPSYKDAGLSLWCDQEPPGPTAPSSPPPTPPLSRWMDAPVYLTITVEDTGRGLTQDEMKMLFRRFQQASPKTHVEYGGSGLGLFISRQLVKLQGGQIGVASTAGVGSTFGFYVKAERCPAPRAKVQPRKVAAAAAGKRQPQRPGMMTTLNSDSVRTVQDHMMSDASSPGVKEVAEQQATPSYLLVVEDNLVNQKVMSKQLKRAGYQVAVANHGLEALDYIRNSVFCRKEEDGGVKLDVVLMDVEMPIQDGLTCTRHIRNMEQAGEVVGSVPIIAVTANARAEQQAAVLDAGMNSIVTKPFKMSELIPVLERVKRKREAVADLARD